MATLVSNRFIWMYENMYVPKKEDVHLQFQWLSVIFKIRINIYVLQVSSEITYTELGQFT